MPTFSPTVNPDWGYTKERTPRVLKVEFGDGYEGSAKDGINNNPLKISFTWGDIDDTEKDLIMDFLDARGGSESFDYTLPDELTSRTIKCMKYSAKYFALEAWQVDAVFEEKFLP